MSESDEIYTGSIERAKSLTSPMPLNDVELGGTFDFSIQTMAEYMELN